MTGRKGRVGLYEVLFISDPLRDAIERQATLKEMQEATSPSSFVSMKRYARLVMEKGLAAPEDLSAIFPPAPTAGGPPQPRAAVPE
jgi:type II secretory ATPase GspE/PulE/Tfp pilus assembly ATPase PilB-like protein